MPPAAIHSAEVVVHCSDLDTSLDFFTKQLGFRVDLIYPADAPATAVISAYGVRLRLECLQEAKVIVPVQLRLHADLAQVPAPHQFTGPDGIIITFVDAAPKIVIPPGTQEWIVSRNGDANAWTTGRAGMQYRDLIPGRLGGRFVASHIRIPDGGEVPDYVHFHRVRFQMIYCKAGWVRVVYEDQGPPFVMHAGDCVLQPPQIRHRVLESSAGLEVIELGCPAIHDTVADHDLKLPTASINAARDFSGQRFTHQIAAQAKWHVEENNIESRDLGIYGATNGLARARVMRAMGITGAVSATRVPQTANTTVSAKEVFFLMVLHGKLTVNARGFGEQTLGGADSLVIPCGTDYNILAAEGVAWMEVAI
jgi:quercetin dioxygenase-like cupin family protein